MQMPKTYNDEGQLNVIIETPKGSVYKYDYNQKLQLFCLSKSLPVGMHFPYDFGFIPGTVGGDGDPLDVLVLSPAPLITGCLVTVTLIGVLEAKQTENNKTNRNDRLIGYVHTYAGDEYTAFSHVKELPQQLIQEIEAFFIQYNHLEGKHFEPLEWRGPKRADAVLEAGIKSNR